jgi:hypothetical protein
LPRARRRRRAGLDPAGKAEAVNFADYRIARHAVAELRRNLAGAFSVEPQLPQKLNLFICPIHVGLISPGLKTPAVR